MAAPVVMTTIWLFTPTEWSCRTKSDQLGRWYRSDLAASTAMSAKSPSPVRARFPRLIQVDPDYVFRSADRGKPELSTFDAPAFGLAGAIPVWPVSASHCVADITMPELRYIVDPAKPPLTSVEHL